MHTIRVNTDVLSEKHSELASVERDLRRISSEIRSISNGLTWKISVSSSVKAKLAAYCLFVDELGRRTGTLASTATELATAYRNLERQLSGKESNSWIAHILQSVEQADLPFWRRIIFPMVPFRRKLSSFVVGPAAAAIPIIGTLDSWISGTPFYKWITEDASMDGSVYTLPGSDEDNYLKVLHGKGSVKLDPDYGEYKYSDHVVEQREIPNKFSEKYDKEEYGNQEKWYKQRGTVVEKGIEAKLEGSVIDEQISGDNGWAEGSVNGKVLTGELHASAAAGLYVFEKDPKTGETKRIFSPAVTAEVGASVAAFEVDAQGRIGIGDDKKGLGVYGNADAKVLSAEAKAKASFIPGKEAYAGASAEADLVKVTGAAGVSVLGTDVGVTGSLKVGVGAHANVGYTDGKFKVDVGAAVGIGFDVGFEVDISGTVDAVCGWCESVWHGLFG